MNIIIQKLYRLQQIEMGPEPDTPENQEIIKQLRGEIPVQIIGHYDRLRARNKEGVARVRNAVCMGCKMRLTTADFLAVKVGEDISVCQNCARYLIYIPEDDELQSQAALNPEPIKTVKAPAGKIEPIKPPEAPKKRARKTKSAKNVRRKMSGK